MEQRKYNVTVGSIRIEQYFIGFVAKMVRREDGEVTYYQGRVYLGEDVTPHVQVATPHENGGLQVVSSFPIPNGLSIPQFQKFVSQKLNNGVREAVSGA